VVEPQPLLPCRLPDPAQLPLPRPLISIESRAVPPQRADFCGHLRGSNAGHDIGYRLVPCGVDYDVSGQLAAVGEDDRPLGNALDAPPAEPDLAVGNQLGRADVVLVPRESTVVEGAEPGVIFRVVQPEPNLAQPFVKVRVALQGFPDQGPLEGRHQPQGDGRDHDVSLLPAEPRRLREQRVHVELAERLAPDDERRRPLHHRDVSPVLPQVLKDVVPRGVRADDDAFLAVEIVLLAAVGRRMVLQPREGLGPLDGRRAGGAVKT
jgi:hypothetical protein